MTKNKMKTYETFGKVEMALQLAADKKLYIVCEPPESGAAIFASSSKKTAISFCKKQSEGYSVDLYTLGQDGEYVSQCEQTTELAAYPSGKELK